MKKIAILLTLLLAGCATNTPPAKDPRVSSYWLWVNTQRPLAEAGQLKWSEYYKGLYDRYVALGAPSEVLRLVNEANWAAQKYESGATSKEEFEYRQRDLRAQLDAVGQQMRDRDQARQKAAAAEQRASMIAALQLMQATQPRPLTVTPVTPGLTEPTQSASAGVTAFWTGKQQQVQTVTYQYGWNCEYNYAGRTFWRTFVGSCPLSVQVQ